MGSACLVFSLVIIIVSQIFKLGKTFLLANLVDSSSFRNFFVSCRLSEKCLLLTD